MSVTFVAIREEARQNSRKIGRTTKRTDTRTVPTSRADGGTVVRGTITPIANRAAAMKRTVFSGRLESLTLICHTRENYDSGTPKTIPNQAMELACGI